MRAAVTPYIFVAGYFLTKIPSRDEHSLPNANESQLKRLLQAD
jgi:hypothetical protein